MKINLDTPSPEMDQDQSAKLQRDNTTALRKTLNSTGVFILAEAKRNTATTLAAAATPTLIQGFEEVIVSSGGLIDIVFYTTNDVGPGVDIVFYLYVDGVSASTIGAAAVGATVAINSSLNYKAILGEGRHKIQMFYSSVGSFIISRSSTDTRLTISETRI